jgi:hypothetical protein
MPADMKRAADREDPTTVSIKTGSQVPVKMEIKRGGKTTAHQSDKNQFFN